MDDLSRLKIAVVVIGFLLVVVAVASIGAFRVLVAKLDDAKLNPLPKPRMVVVGFGSTMVSGNSSARISIQVQVLFRPEYLQIPAEIANHFLITDIEIGEKSQFVSPGCVPGSMFSTRFKLKKPGEIRLMMDTVRVGETISIWVANQHYEAVNFQGALVGVIPG